MQALPLVGAGRNLPANLALNHDPFSFLSASFLLYAAMTVRVKDNVTSRRIS